MASCLADCPLGYKILDEKGSGITVIPDFSAPAAAGLLPSLLLTSVMLRHLPNLIEVREIFPLTQLRLS